MFSLMSSTSSDEITSPEKFVIRNCFSVSNVEESSAETIYSPGGIGASILKLRLKSLWLIKRYGAFNERRVGVLRGAAELSSVGEEAVEFGVCVGLSDGNV